MSYRKLRIVVTGATGFIGSRLVEQLMRLGHEITVLKRRSSALDRLAESLDRIYTYNIEMGGINDALNPEGSIDAVIHFATNYGREGECVSAVYRTNLMLGLELLETAIFRKVPLFLNIDTALDRSVNFYTLSKKQFLEIAVKFARQRRIKLWNIKLENVFGPGDDPAKFASYVLQECARNARELRLTAGAQKRDFIYVDDVIEALLLIIEIAVQSRKYVRSFSVGSGSAISLKTFAEKTKILSNSLTKLNFGAIPYRKNEIMFSQADIRKLKRLGWQPTHSIEDGIRKSLEWYQNV